MILRPRSRRSGDRDRTTFFPWRLSLRRRRIARLFLALLALLPMGAGAQKFTHTEARHTHSIGLTPDGTRLLALHTDDARLSVFDVSDAGNNPAPVLLAEIPVGIEPVSLRARTDDEVWVVSELGDSVAVVSLSRQAVIDTLRAPDEPADVAFAGGKAFVSCSRNNLLRVFDAATRQELATIPLGGLVPRALATDAAGTSVFAAFLHSGNGTTILPPARAPNQPAPTNPDLPAAPKTGLIVPAGDARIDYTVLDRDVAQIGVATLAVTRYFSGAGTNLFDLAVQPGTGDVWVANTEARNLVRFEPNLRGHFVDNRLTRISTATSAAVVFDLNPGVDYSLLPNPAAQATALAQPVAVVFNASGSELWVAAFGSDRVARISTATGGIAGSIDLRAPGEGSRRMRGPRALALDEARARLYVLNRIAGTLAVIGTETGSVLAEVPLGTRDPMPAAIHAGRGFLFDARLSGNGTASCASCHLDADRDGLAWDLGVPDGEMTTVMGANLSAHDKRPRPRVMHPMKGPMTTQTLRGMSGGAPFHWRGDRPTLGSFNRTFDELMGGSPLSADDIAALETYLLSLRHHPNPNRPLDGSLPATFAGGNPTRGQTLFNHHVNHCGVCHLPPRGSDNNIDLHQEVGASQPLKNPSLATTYQRAFFNPQTGQQSFSGFGLGHDGTGFVLPTVHPYVLDQLRGADFNDVAAFVLCFDTGTAPAVGDSVTTTAATASAALGGIARLESLNQSQALDLVVRGVIGGLARNFIYARSLGLYVPDEFGMASLSRSELLAALGPDDALTFLGVPPGEGARFGGDLKRTAALGTDSFFTRDATRPFDVPAAIGVLGNDLRVAAPEDVPVLSVPPTLGTLALAGDGALRYTPGRTFRTVGIDRFSYRVWLGGDPLNATADTTATVSTMASAAGRYFGLLKTDGTGGIAGYVAATASAGGAWTGTARIGAVSHALNGTVGADGELRFARAPKLNLTLRLFVEDAGSSNGHYRRRIRATVRIDTALFAADLHRSPFYNASPAPGAGRRVLTLPVSDASPNAPLSAMSATLTISRTGVASISARIGDGTRFTFSAPLDERTGGGWTLPVYAPVYRFPPGSVSGELRFDPANPAGISGALTAVKPAQTRPAAAGFTVTYHASAPPAAP